MEEHKKGSISISAPPEAKKVIKAFREKWGINQKVVWAGLTKWFVKQSEAVQFAVIGVVPGGLSEAAMAEILRKAADELDNGTSAQTAAEILQVVEDEEEDKEETPAGHKRPLPLGRGQPSQVGRSK